MSIRSSYPIFVLALLAAACDTKKDTDTHDTDTADTSVEDSGTSDTGDTGASGDTGVPGETGAVSAPAWGEAPTSDDLSALAAASSLDLALSAASPFTDRVLRARVDGLDAGDEIVLLAASIGSAETCDLSCVQAANVGVLARATAESTSVEFALGDVWPATIDATHYAIIALKLGASPEIGAAVRVFSDIPAYAGSYNDEFGGTLDVDAYEMADAWGSVYEVYGATATAIIARNGDANAYNPALWSRFDFTQSGGTTYYCQTSYNSESLEAVLYVEAADATDPATSGCGGFAWTALTEAPPVYAGAYEPGFIFTDANTTIGTEVWNTESVAYASRWWLASDNAGSYTRFDSTYVGETDYVCRSTPAPTWLEARAAAADPTDPASAGCNGGAWYEITPLTP